MGIVRLMPIRVMIFPEDDNPYQDLLRRALEGSEVETRYLSVNSHARIIKLCVLPWALLRRLAAERRMGYSILHIHWLFPFFLPTRLPGAKSLAYCNTMIFLLGARLLGYKLVWTVHNLVPHDRVTTNDLQIRRSLARQSSAVIVHGESTVQDMVIHRIDTSRVTVVPIGSYASLYPQDITREQARSRLGIEDDGLTFLFFGRVVPYKGVRALLDAFLELSAQHPTARLVIAGPCSDVGESEVVKQKASRSGRITVELDYIPDARVQEFMLASDVAVYPFTRMTTTSSVIVSMGFGLPTIAPRLGSLRDLPDGVGILYDPEDAQGLARSLAAAVEQRARLAEMGARARSYVDGLSWERSAAATHEIYRSVVQSDDA